LGDRQKTDKKGGWGLDLQPLGTLNQGFFEGFCDVTKVVIIQKII
jgi:hypothetical protein